MSYTFAGKGGTSWGLKTYNQIFAQNSETVGAAEYWDKSLVQNYDTVICSTNHRLLVAYYRNGNPANQLFWYGTGIYEMQNDGGNSLYPGSYCVMVETGGDGGLTNAVRPSVTRYTSGGEERCVGVCLSTAVVTETYQEVPVLVATSGVWPIMANSSSPPVYGSHVKITESTGSTNGGTVQSNAGAADGLIGKCYNTTFNIITSTAASPSTRAGALVSLWGTSTESD